MFIHLLRIDLPSFLPRWKKITTVILHGLILCLLTFATASAHDIVFDATLRELEVAADAKTVSTNFNFRNRGEKPSKIRKFRASCSCMVASMMNDQLNYAPGDSGTIQVKIDLHNLTGNVEKAVFVFLEDDPDSRPSITLLVRLQIPTIVAVEPKTLIWPINGIADTKTIRIRMNHSQPLQITAVGCSSDVYAHKLRTIEAGKSYEIDVTPRDTRGMTLGVIRIETDCDIPRHSIQQVFAICRRPSPGETQVSP